MDCEKFLSLLDKYLDNECTEAEKALFEEHAAACASCADELSFSLSIKATLSSMPKMVAPADFLDNLNKKIDAENISHSAAHSRFGFVYKASTAAAACLLFAVMLGTDAWKTPYVPDNSDTVISEIVSVDNINKETPVQVPVQKSGEIPQTDPVSEIPLPAVVAKSVPSGVGKSIPTVSAGAPSVYYTSSVSDSAKEAESSSVKDIPIQAIINAADDTPHQDTPVVQPVPAEAESHTTSSENVIVAQASTPHSSIVLPVYMDDKDSIIVSPSVQRSSKINLYDYELIENENLLEAFSLAKLPDNKQIVATPTALSAVSHLAENTGESFDLNISGAGSGSFFVSEADEARVADILNKYCSVEKDKCFLLTGKNYSAFIKELDKEGISYRGYMISENSSNVSFKLMIS